MAITWEQRNQLIAEVHRNDPTIGTRLPATKEIAELRAVYEHERDNSTRALAPLK